MVFLNLLLLGGLAAIAAPIVIHLLHRTRVVPRPWGAMMFLKDVVAERARRLRFHEWLLLLTRAGIVACLALAMMRPALLSPGVRSPETHTSTVLLLDDSYSMNAGRPRAAWEELREQALRYLDTLRKGDDVTVMFFSSAGKGPPPAALFDLDRAREIVQTAVPRHERTDVPRSLTAALQHLETRHNPQRELAVITDGQAAGWSLEDGARWSFIANAVRTSPLRPKILISTVAEARPENLAVTRLAASRAIVDPYTPVTFQFTIANGGLEEVREVSVTFSVDGAAKTTRRIDLPAGGREELAFEHRFARAGSHCVSARLRSARDVLGDDDELLHSVVVFDRLPVLAVDGDRRETELGGDAGFLRLALAPLDDDDPSWRTVIEPAVVDPTDLRNLDFSKYRAVVLANVAALPGPVVSELERFVVAGGGLLVALGDRVQAEAYNRDLYRQGAGLLPVALERPAGITARRNDPLRLVAETGPAAMEPVRLAGITAGAAALDLFRPEKGQDWTRARIRAYFGTATLPGSDDVRVLASFSNGQAALIQKKLGEGKVILYTSALDTDWSDLPVHPFYVPLMQSLIFDLASAVIPPRNLETGQMISYAAGGEAVSKPHVLFPPQGAPIALKPLRQGGLTIFNHEDSAQPGLYAVAPDGAPAEDRVLYAVTAERSESDLSRLKDGDFQRLARDLGARHARNWNDVARWIGLESGGFEVSPFFILAAIALCFFEIYLTRRWS